MERLLLVVAVIGCRMPANTTLAELPGLGVDVAANREVDVNSNSASALRASSIEVDVFYDTAMFRAAHGGTCATIDADATFNGISLDLPQQGETNDDFDDCQPPYFTADLQMGAADEGHLVLSDGSVTVRADYAAGAIAAPIAKPTTGSWSFVDGEPIAVTWSRPEELATLDPSNITAEFTDADANGFSFEAIGHTDTEIQFTVPSPAPVTGDGVLDIGIDPGATFEQGSATTCTGATQCTYSSILAYQHTAHID